MNKVNLKNYNNAWYSPGNIVKLSIWYVVSLCFFRSAIPFPQMLKRLLLILFGCTIGKSSVIKPCVKIKYPWFLAMGNNVWIGEGVWIDNLTWVRIGSNVCISQDALLLSGNHNYKSSTFDLLLKEIIMEDGVWIGANATVCGGVTCRNHSILTVGSVANKDLEAYSIYQGIPAQKIRDRIIDK